MIYRVDSAAYRRFARLPAPPAEQWHHCDPNPDEPFDFLADPVTLYAYKAGMARRPEYEDYYLHLVTPERGFVLQHIVGNRWFPRQVRHRPASPGVDVHGVVESVCLENDVLPFDHSSRLMQSDRSHSHLLSCLHTATARAHKDPDDLHYFVNDGSAECAVRTAVAWTSFQCGQPIGEPCEENYVNNVMHPFGPDMWAGYAPTLIFFRGEDYHHFLWVHSESHLRFLVEQTLSANKEVAAGAEPGSGGECPICFEPLHASDAACRPVPAYDDDQVDKRDLHLSTRLSGRTSVAPFRCGHMLCVDCALAHRLTEAEHLSACPVCRNPETSATDFVSLPLSPTPTDEEQPAAPAQPARAPRVSKARKATKRSGARRR